MRALVTGSAGFAGSHLVASLLADGHKVRGFDIAEGNDIRDDEQVRAAVREFRPDQVFHLAAVARPAQAREDPATAWQVNSGAVLYVLEAVREYAPSAKVLLCGSSDEYGPSAEAVDEWSLCDPRGPYGASKLAQTMIGVAWANAFGMHVVVTRAWMHTGPSSPPEAAVSGFAKKIIAVERGEADKVAHGDLSVLVDLTDGRDVVRAYRLAIGCPPGIYNVCGEQRRPLSEVMAGLLAGSSLVGRRVLERFPSFGKGTDMPLGSAAKLHQLTGWKPEIPLSQTLGDLLDYWRNKP